MKIYVASSWRNPYQPDIVEALRSKGHEVYDFRNPRPGDRGFHWSQIDPNYKNWQPAEYRQALDHPMSETGFKSDFDAMKWADVFVGVAPFGRSTSLEMGWAAGAGKATILYLPEMLGEAELMVKMCDRICVSRTELFAALLEAHDIQASPMDAVTYMLCRVTACPEFAHVLLATEALSRLVRVFARWHGKTSEEVMDWITSNAELTRQEVGIKGIEMRRIPIERDGNE